MLRLGVIGLGRRARHMVRDMLSEEPELRLTDVADPDPQRVRDEASKHTPICFDDATFHPDAARLLEHADRLDGIVIGTRCRLHTEMACKVAPTGLPLFLEKPVAIDRRQVAALAAAFEGREDRVVVSFPLRVTPLFQRVMAIVRSDRLGPVNQIQAVNNVNYGGCYFGGWYRNYDDTGGLWLQKATHDLDYLNLIAKARPLMIAATSTQGVYGGDKPHDLHCTSCDEAATCIESHVSLDRRPNDGGMSEYENGHDHPCCFSREIRNQDAGSALLLYEGGLHISYTQNFVSRRGAGRRGAIITGHAGTVQFDWVSEVVNVIDHHREHDESFEVKASDDHSGGDTVLIRDFISLMRGGSSTSGDLRDGLLSATMCLAARESSHTHAFTPIVPPWTTPQAIPAPAPAPEPPMD